jgi:NitT/TauT family transport system ATP-binding protein
MNISVRNLSFSYPEGKLRRKTPRGAGEKPLFNNFSADFYGGERPLVILGPSGSGKTTFLKLLGGLLKPQAGEILFSDEGMQIDPAVGNKLPGKTAFMFQESRLLPWLTVLENVSLPLRKIFGIEEARTRARYFLSLVSLEDKEMSYPNELSGGQAQRVSMARAFAWPAPALFMDEPFQSLDIPLRINLMENCLSLLEKENFSNKSLSKINRLLIAVTHDPREALYMGGRVIVLGRRGEGIVFDETVNLGSEDRTYGSAAGLDLERKIIKALGD